MNIAKSLESSLLISSKGRLRSLNFASFFFYALLSIKVYFLFLPGSFYLNDDFIPFIDHALLNPFTHPWNMANTYPFPYGIVTYLSLYLFKGIGYWCLGTNTLGQTPLSFFFAKLPLLLYDCLLYSQLVRYVPRSKKKVLNYYWANPVVFFINYIHGQLDIISVFFCFLALIKLTQKKNNLAALLFAFAISAKFQIALVLPLAGIYLVLNHYVDWSLKKMPLWPFIFLLTTLILFTPFFFVQQLGHVTLISSEAFRVFNLKIILGHNKEIYLGIMILLCVILRTMFSYKMTHEGLIYASAILFLTLLLILDTMPGWYFWIIPFITLLHCTYNIVPKILYPLFFTSYLLHFNAEIIYQNPQFVPYFSNITYSFLQLTLLAYALFIWLVILPKTSPLKRRFRPIVVGLSGDSSVGKNLTSKLIGDILGRNDTSIIEGDDYHKWERGNDQWKNLTHLNPEANHLDHLSHNIHEALLGRYFHWHEYSHETGQFLSPKEFQSKKALIIQGLHAFYFSKVRDVMDLKIFLHPEEKLRTRWKIKRDVEERGHQKSQVLQHLKRREEDSLNFIAPQKNFANLVVEYCELDNSEHYQVTYTMTKDPQIYSLVNELKKIHSLKIETNLSPTDFNQMTLKVSGTISKNEIESIAHHLFQNIKQITRSNCPPHWSFNDTGVTQLVVLLLIKIKIEKDFL